jgi:hypothetical protein
MRTGHRCPAHIGILAALVGREDAHAGGRQLDLGPVARELGTPDRGVRGARTQRPPKDTRPETSPPRGWLPASATIMTPCA